MSSHLKMLQAELSGSIVAASEAMGRAVAVTDSEIVTGKSGLFSKHIERFPLANLASVQLNPNPSAMLLSLEFDGPETKSVTFMFPATSENELRQIVDFLERSMQRSGKGGARS
jgi:hypothetical protein